MEKPVLEIEPIEDIDQYKDSNFMELLRKITVKKMKQDKKNHK